MTPVEELRAAAAFLREARDKASGGRWFLYDAGKDDDEYEGMYWVVSDRNGPVTAPMRLNEGVCVEQDGEHGIADGSWMVLMQPRTAEPLERWLEDTAQWWGIALSTPATDAALDFARMILRGRP